MCLLMGYFGKTLLLFSIATITYGYHQVFQITSTETRATNTRCDEGTGGVQLATPLTSTALGCGEFMFTYKLQPLTEIKRFLYTEMVDIRKHI